MYKLIGIMGKAGAGKDKLLSFICAKRPEFNEVISCTTRPPRENEKNGINYYFLTSDEFLDRMYDGRMLEVSNFRGWAYGTSTDALDENKINIGVFNPEGIDKLFSLDHHIDLYVVYLIADDKTRLLRQLNREEHPDVQEIVRRFGTDEKDFQDVIEDFHPHVYANEQNCPIDLLADEIIQDLEDWIKA